MVLQAKVKVGAYLVANAQAYELVEPGEGPLHGSAGLAQPGAVLDTSAGDLGCDAAGLEDAAVPVVVVAAVGEQSARPVPRTSRSPRMRGDCVR